MTNPQFDWYMNLIGDWEDPCPEPVIERIEDSVNVSVLRDDLFEYGSKIRFLDYFVKNLPHRELVYGSSPAWGYAQISLGYLARKYGKKCVVFAAKRSTPHPYQAKAIELGVEFRWVPMGFLAVTEARAREYAAASDDRLLLPMGLRCDSALACIAKVARALPINPTDVWVASSSCTLANGLKLAWPFSEVHCVTVGHAPTLVELGGNTMHESGYRFQQAVRKRDRPPYPSAENYDAKVWPVFCANKRPGVHLIWNVGA